MVSYSQIKASNVLITDGPRVSVFVGGTSGIGNYTARALVSTGASVRVYIIGRESSEARTRAFIEELNAINPKAEIIWIAGEVSLLAEVTRVCGIIKEKESRIDLLFLTTGYAPVGAREDTAEGIEITQTLAYYSRMLFIVQLLPLLHEAENPRVISVLGGGLERTSGIILDDMELRKPSNFGPINGQIHCGTMNTVFMNKLARENPEVTFFHSWPGWVNTGNVNRGYEPNSKWAWFVWLFLEHIIELFGFSYEESGQRYLFQCTSAAYGGQGTPWNGKIGVNTMNETGKGLFLVNYKCDCTPNSKVVAELRQKAEDKVWDYTQEIFKRYM
ncbi:hypothetical protein F5B22DRAFT_237095 [Xylaria bambusicola]|uniref:uncharacterized protein n=1 Tax=Xylaria bambusicola TaxID=326684 RepID=UPI0020085786|nr:uncharacterized protein F5B22DRAFT_237095 [Xylaria bambusicola]KAI0514354.1 hypothetical protein F5B22DRAFT_237095 [Xylaria bambusicola]